MSTIMIPLILDMVKDYRCKFYILIFVALTLNKFHRYSTSNDNGQGIWNLGDGQNAWRTTVTIILNHCQCLIFFILISWFLTGLKLLQNTPLRSGLLLSRCRVSIIHQLKAFGDGNTKGKGIVFTKQYLLANQRVYLIWTMSSTCVYLTKETYSY